MRRAECFKFRDPGKELAIVAGLYWLPEPRDWRAQLRALANESDRAWDSAVALANTRLDFIRTNALDETLRRIQGEAPPPGLGTKPVRLAVLGSSTLAHLHGGIRVAGLRRGIHIATYENDYGQYWQEVSDPGSALHAFRPNTVLLALDGHHLTAGVTAAMDGGEADAALQATVERVRACWRMLNEAFGCQVIQQLALPVHPPVMGGNEHRLPGSRASFLSRLSAELRIAADADNVDLLALDARAASDGLAAWHDAALWHRSKQEVSPAAAPMYGELVARLIAAKQGRSYKCLVLDLDNTVWGGVVGDDGVDGLVLGQGSALGEGYVAFQEYARELSRRGVILAVVSKNDEANALEPFERHPEMVLRRGDIACFIANWADKAGNIRAVAQELNIGLDALVFIDDNPFERDLVRQELPMVAVPEVSDEPTVFARTLADAGYFEALWVTDDDRARTAQYQGNRQREALKASATDLPSYLRGLEMQLVWRRFDQIGLQRTVQLINKTNQFNLTTRRYTEADVLAIMHDPRSFGLQLRLLDRFGDNGIIAVLIGRMQQNDDLLIDTWLMSCRVLGRQVEPTSLNLIAEHARGLGARRLVGEYIPTKKNGMVKDHYTKLGFATAEQGGTPGVSRFVLDLAEFVPADTFIDVREG
jgi:FkbH-like protein